MKQEILKKYANKKKRSRLLPFIKEIKLLLEHDATQVSIVEYLKDEQNVIISQPVLSTFIKRYIEKNALSKQSKIVINKEKQEINEPEKPIENKKTSIFL